MTSLIAQPSFTKLPTHRAASGSGGTRMQTNGLLDPCLPVRSLLGKTAPLHPCKFAARAKTMDGASCRDRVFIGLLEAFRGHGGLLRGDELAGAVTRAGRGDYAG